jgi:O-antigen/teichoic acid export membrane protein
MLVGTWAQVGISLIVLKVGTFSVWPNFSGDAWLKLIVKGIPAIGLMLGQAAVLRFDRILLGLYLAASAVGIYSVSATATEIVWLLPVGLAQILFHGFASKSVDALAATRARVASLAFAVVTAVAMYAIAPIAVDWLVGGQFADAVTPLRILLIGAVLFSSYQLDAYVLAARDRIGLAAAATIAGFSAMLLLDLIAIPRYGIVGAAWASVIAYGLMAAVARAMVARIQRQPDLAAQTSGI